MPIYCFRDTETDEVFDIMMRISELDNYKEANPNHVRVIEAPNIVSGVSITGKMDSGFKDVLSKISEAHPGSPLADNHGKKSIKQVQTERAIRKWRSSE
jgi:predicted nucleic acid-binding Zn ribbon protein